MSDARPDRNDIDTERPPSVVPRGLQVSRVCRVHRDEIVNECLEEVEIRRTPAPVVPLRPYRFFFRFLLVEAGPLVLLGLRAMRPPVFRVRPGGLGPRDGIGPAPPDLGPPRGYLGRSRDVRRGQFEDFFEGVFSVSGSRTHEFAAVSP